MSKYDPLADHLRGSGEASVSMTFDEIEHIVGTKLPPSAFKHRAWWSNNPINSVITCAWLEAGYKTANVDMPGRKLVFRKSVSDDLLSETGDGQHAQEESQASETVCAGSFSRVFGALKGTVTIKAGTDLSSPVGEKWDATR